MIKALVRWLLPQNVFVVWGKQTPAGPFEISAVFFDQARATDWRDYRAKMWPRGVWHLDCLKVS